MANIKVKRSSVAGKVPTITDLALGEIAVNTYDGLAFIKKSVDGVESIVALGGLGGSAGDLQDRSIYIATSGQTTFSAQYSAPYVDVYLNGVLLSPSDYTATNGTSVILGTGAVVGDIVQIIGHKILGVAGTLALSGGTMTGAINFDSSQTWPTFNQNTTGSAATLTTPRTIAVTGDVAYTSAAFDGSGNVTGVATLSNSGVTAGTYGSDTNIPQLAVDSKGRVTSVTNVAVSIPSGALTFTGDVTGTGSTGATTDLTLAATGTAGTYTKVTTDSKGRVTSGTTLVAGDIPSLDASKIISGTIDAARLPSYVDDVVEAANLAGFPATGETGKIYVALDTNKAYRWSGSTYVYITSGAVDSVAGRTGVVTLTSSDVGLGSVDNTSDAAKPVSTAQQTALNLKANLASPTFTGTVAGITAAMVGLGSVENKSSATIRGEITSSNVTSALGFTPYNSTNPSGYITSSASITGNAATATSATSATRLNSSNYIEQAGNQGSWNADFQATPAGSVRYGGDVGASTTNNPGGSWWIQENFRHTNSSNYWGTQVAWGWEDNANKLATRNVTGGTFGGWVYYLNSSNFTSYAMPVGSSATNSVDVRAPIFYDSNDTSYYVDPNGTSKLVNLGLGGATPDVRLSVSGDTHISSVLYLGGTAGTVGSWGSRDYTTSGLRYFNASTYEFNNYGYGSTYTFLLNASYAQHSASVRAPIFYDSDNTAYYTDPNATSNLLGLTVSNTISGNISGYSKWIDRVPAYQWSNSTLPSGYNSGVETSFVSADQGWPQYGVVLSVMGRDTVDPGGNFQLYMGHGASYGGLGLRVRSVNQTTNLWTSWKILLDESNYTSYAMPAGSSATNSVDVRAPIFYDANNTAYYGDFASTSNLNGILTTSAVSDNNNGLRNVLPGGGSNVTGTPTVTGAIVITLPTTSNPMVRFTVKVYTYDNLSFDVHCGGHTSSGTWYNTFAYMGTQNRGALNVRFCYGGGQLFVYIGELGTSWSYPQVFVTDVQVGYAAYSAGEWDNGWSISYNSSTYNNISSTHTVYPPTSSSNNINPAYASIYYDSNDTGYYVDPNSTSNLYNLQLTGGKHTYLYINPGNGYEAMVRYNGGTASGWYTGKRTSGQLVDTDSFHFYSEAAGATVAGVTAGGHFFASGSFRAPIFYDLDNTGYYLDPASTSSLNTMKTAGSVVIGGNFENNPYAAVGSTRLLFGGGNDPDNYYIGTNLNDYGGNYTKLDLRWHTGIRMGAQPGYGGIRFFDSEDLGTQIFSIGETDTNVRVSSALYTPITYDSNNTSYYIDPAGTSNLNALLVNGVAVASLPSQTGNSGKFLYSNGSTASWEYAALPPTVPTNVSAGPDSANSIVVSYTQGANGSQNRIYYSTTSPVTTSSAFVVGGVSSGTITGLSTATTYYVAVATHSLIATVLSTQLTTATPPVGTAIYTSGQTIDVTSGTASFLAGSGVTSIKIECAGGGGGGGGSWNYSGAPGGTGGVAAGIYDLSAGRLFTYYVGGGGNNGSQYGNPGHGGGASAVVLYGGFTPIVAAGGAGGGGDGWNSTAGTGGAGGTAVNQTGPFVGDGIAGVNVGGGDGGGGGSSVAGTNSSNSLSNAVGRIGGKGGNLGGSGGGGTSGYGQGGSYSTNYYWGGGGGGGGYFGGAGGWGSSSGAGGGGGSSYLATGISPASASISGGVAAGPGVTGGPGRVKITFI